MSQKETFYLPPKVEPASISVSSVSERETQRLKALYQYQILDTPPEEVFDEVTELAAEIFSVPIALISLIDSHRQWFKSKLGLTLTETKRELSFCAHTILQTDILIVLDALLDERFAANELVTSSPYIRFYAGVPLINSEQLALGALCIIDTVPRTLIIEQQVVLQRLANQVMKKLEQRRNQLLLSVSQPLVKDNSSIELLANGNNKNQQINEGRSTKAEGRRDVISGEFNPLLITDQQIKDLLGDSDPCSLSVAADDRRSEQKELLPSASCPLPFLVQPVFSSSQVEFLALAETIPIAIVVARITDGLVLYANQHACLMFGVSKDESLSYQTTQFYYDPDQRQFLLDELKTKSYISNYEIYAKKADGTLFWISASIQQISFNGESACLNTFTNITQRKQAELELRKANRAWKTLSECSQIVIRASSESELLQAICNIMIEIGGYRFAWIGFAEQNQTKRVLPVAYSGYEEGYLESLNITWDDSEQGRGPTGTAIRTGQTFTIRNILVDPSYIPWRQQAIQRGYAAAIALPLINEGNVFGALNIYAEAADAFDSEEVSLLTKVADNLAYGIMVWRDSASADLSVRIIRQQVEETLRQQIEQERLISTISHRIRQSLNLDEILTTTVQEVRQFLQAERVFIYRFESDWGGTVIVESVEAGCLSILGEIVKDSYFVETCGKSYKEGRIQATDDIYASELNACHIGFLEHFHIRANLVVPIVQGELWGLLVANQCTKPRQWQEVEINLLKQLATQVAIAIQQSELYQQLHTANLKLHSLANEDGLTQVANRRYFDEYLNKEWRRSAREQNSLSLILCDIDFFKTYNDTYGHLQGDSCLQQVALAISRAIKRPADLVARYGGEEFAIIMPNTNALGAVQVAEFIRYEVQALKIVHAGSSVNKYVTVSLGIASTIPNHQLEPTSLIAAADKALYQAKALGRDRFFLSQSQPSC